MRRNLGLDLAVTAASRSCLTDERGEVIKESKFSLRRNDFERLYEETIHGMSSSDELVVVMEPTANSWMVAAAFFKSKGARVHLLKPTQASKLREYYSKHVKNDRLDAKLLARVSLLHPDGMNEAYVPAAEQGTLRRTVARRARLVKEVAIHRRRVRNLLQWAMPGMNEVLGEDLGKSAMAVLGRYGNPKTLVRLAKKRIADLLIKTSLGSWREDKAEQILAVARQAIELWQGLEGCDFEEIEKDLAAEARMISALESEIKELDKRASELLGFVDPDGLYLSMPGFADRNATSVAGRLGDPSRFKNSSSVRCYFGIIPGTDQSGEAEGKPAITKAGDRILRTSMYIAAETARKEDPQLAQIYFKQMVEKGNHHIKAVCAVATAMASRLATVLREGRPYEVRDVDGTPVDKATAKKIIADRYTVPPEIRAARRQVTRSKRRKGRHLDGVRSKTAKSSPPEEEAPGKDRSLVVMRA